MKKFSYVFFAATIVSLSGCGEKPTAPTSAASVKASDAKSKSPLDAPYKLKGGEEVEIDELFAIFPSYLKPSYDSADFDAKTGATVVQKLKFVAPGDYEGDDGFSVARAEFYGVDMAAIERVKDAGAAALDAPMETIFEKVRLFGVAGLDQSAPTQTTIEAIEIDRLRVRQGGVPESDNGVSGLAALINAFDMAGLYFKDIRSEGGDGSTAQIEFSAPDLRFVGIHGGKLSAILAKDLDYKITQSAEVIAGAARGMGPAGDIFVNGPLRGFIAPENQRTTIELFEWRDIDFSGLMAFGLKGEEPPITARDLINLGALRADNTQTFIGDRRLSVVPEAIISAMEFAWLAPSKVRAVTRGGEYDFTAYLPPEEEEAIAVLKKHGLNKVKGDSDFAFDWNADKGAAVLSTGFDSSGFADFDIDAAIDGLVLKKIQAARSEGDDAAILNLGSLKSLSIVFDDETMLDAFYELSALQAGGSADDMRRATPSLLRFTSMELGRKSPRLKDYANALADFLEEGGRLEIRAAPEAPVSLAELQAVAGQGPEAAANLINLTVTHSD